jgi:cytochrome c-type biogenesis protein CcmH/NrfG
VTAPAGAIIESARPAVERLASARDAASLVAAWTAIEAALQSAATDHTLVGQGLVRDLRQRNVLTLDQGHALIELLAAHDRAVVPGYAVTDADVAAARDTLNQLAAAPPPITPVPMSAAPPAAATAPIPVTQGQIGAGKVLGFVALLAIIAGGVAYGVVAWRKQSAGRAAPASYSADDLVARGMAAYQAGHVDSARVFFNHAVQHDSLDGVPHIFLGRMAREAGDLGTARAELVTAVRLAPKNELAQREMGAALLAAGQYDLAAKFYLRAIQIDPTDRSALGFYGCTLKRLGQTQEATQYLTRAGQGPWTACQ